MGKSGLFIIMLTGLVGCSGGVTRTAKQPIGMNINTKQQRASSQDSAIHNILAQNPNCLSLKQVVDQLKTESQSVVNIYVANLEVGTPGSAAAKGANRLTPLSDASTTAQMLLGTKPLLLETVAGADLASSQVLGDLLNITDLSADCSTAKFQSGTDVITFTNSGSSPQTTQANKTVIPVKRNTGVAGRVAGPAPMTPNPNAPITSHLNLSGPNGELRSYTEDGSTLRIQVTKPVAVSTCTNGAVSNAVQITEIVVMHANPQEQIHLNMAFAQLLKGSLQDVPKSLTDELTPTQPTPVPGSKTPPRPAISGGGIHLDYPDYAMISEVVRKGELQPDALACPKK